MSRISFHTKGNKRIRAKARVRYPHITDGYRDKQLPYRNRARRHCGNSIPVALPPTIDINEFRRRTQS